MWRYRCRYRYTERKRLIEISADDTYLNINRGLEVFHTCPTFIIFIDKY